MEIIVFSAKKIKLVLSCRFKLSKWLGLGILLEMKSWFFEKPDNR